MELVAGTVFFFEWEVALIAFLQSHMGTIAIAAASFFTMLGEQFLLVPIMGLLYWGYDKELGKSVGLNLVTALSWSAMLKNCFFRRRPYLDHPEIRCLKNVDANASAENLVAQGWSFPSAHSTSSVAVYTTLPFCKKHNVPLLIVGILIPVLVGVSRFCLGVHYPTDVFVGWLLGIATIAAVSFIRSKIRNSLVLYTVLFLTAVPGLFFCKTTDYYSSFGLMTGAIWGFYFEEKVVHFQNTRSIIRSILRVIGGIALFLGLSAVMKLLFPEALLHAHPQAAHLVRVLRYAVSTFAAIGVYPLVFRYTAKIGKPEA